MRRFTLAFCAVLLLLVLPVRLLAQQPKLIKVSEFSVSNISSIEERVFMIHAITDKGYFCFKNPNVANTVDVYVSSDASDELSDFDFYFDNVLPALTVIAFVFCDQQIVFLHHLLRDGKALHVFLRGE